MSVQVKHLDVASGLSRRIRDGDLPKGARLPGEHQLAHDFDVSRGTVRQALAALERDGFIAKHAGAGSFVVYDGDLIDESAGWSHALRTRGVRAEPRVLRLQRADLPDLAASLGVPGATFVVVDRLRFLDDGVPISLERSRIPWHPGADGLLGRDPATVSVTDVLARLDRAAVTGEAQATVVRLDPSDAELLERAPGAAFLRVTKTTWAADGSLVEHVVSLLDPDHFTLLARFGPVP